MAIRSLGRDDGPLVSELLHRLKGLGSIDPGEFLDDPRTLLLVADDAGSPVGWLYAYELTRPDGRRAMLLYEIEVTAQARSRGHGRALVEALLAEARLRGHFETWVLADPDNADAAGLYTATGGAAVPQVMYTWDLS